jgi:hypothetical protein
VKLRPGKEDVALAVMREVAHAQAPKFGFFGRDETPEEWHRRREYELELLGRRVAPRPLGPPDPPPPGPRRSRPRASSIQRLLGAVKQLGETA